MKRTHGSSWYLAVAAAGLLACGSSGGGTTGSGTTCGAGTHAQSGSCVPDAAAVTCGDGTSLESGVCLPSATLTCGAGTHAQGGACVPDAMETCGPSTHDEMGVCTPDPPTLASQYGITTAETFDPTGTDLLPDTTNHTYVYVNTGISFGATATKNGIHVFDYDAVESCITSHTGCPTGNTFLPIATAEVEAPIAEGDTNTKWSSHALALSPDGQFAYMPFLVPYSRYSYLDFSARFPHPATGFMKIDARTLKPIKRVDCGGPVHHMNIVHDTLIAAECYSEAGVVWLDPANDDAPAKVFPYGRFEGYPYLSFETPPLAFMDSTTRPRYLVVTVMGHLNSYTDAAGAAHELPGYVAFINEDTMKEEASVATGPFPVWVAFSADGTRAWTTSADADSVYRIDLSKNAMTGKLKATLRAETLVGPGPFGLTLNEDETKLFVNDKAEGVRAGATSVNGNTVTVIDADSASSTYDQVLYTIGLSTNAQTAPHRPDHAYLGPDHNLWNCSNANQTCQVIDPAVTPDNGGSMTQCTRIRNAHSFPACHSDADCPTGMPCDANGKCGGTSVVQETIDCMAAPVLATLQMPDSGEVPAWTTGRGDPHSLVWVHYDGSGAGHVIQDFVRH